MFVPGRYEDILQEAKAGHHLVGSAWSFVSLVAAASVCVSAFNYFI